MLKPIPNKHQEFFDSLGFESLKYGPANKKNRYGQFHWLFFLNDFPFSFSSHQLSRSESSNDRYEVGEIELSVKNLLELMIPHLQGKQPFVTVSNELATSFGYFLRHTIQGYLQPVFEELYPVIQPKQSYFNEELNFPVFEFQFKLEDEGVFYQFIFTWVAFHNQFHIYVGSFNFYTHTNQLKKNLYSQLSTRFQCLHTHSSKECFNHMFALCLFSAVRPTLQLTKEFQLKSLFHPKFAKMLVI